MARPLANRRIGDRLQCGHLFTSTTVRVTSRVRNGVTTTEYRCRICCARQVREWRNRQAKKGEQNGTK